MRANAQYIWDFLKMIGWTKPAVAAMLGNMQTESTINPGLWENFQENNMSKGFGLVQWTPASKFINWANDNGLYYLNIDSQIARIAYEKNNGLQWISTSAYPMSFNEFSRSYLPVAELTAAFMYNYERPASYTTLTTRQTQAQYWFSQLN